MGFRNYTITKLFSTVSYSSRNTLRFKNDPVQYSNVVHKGDKSRNRDDGAGRNRITRTTTVVVTEVILSHQKTR